MTSTNDGKDVKSNQISGPKGKSYYIELYKSLEAQLSGECELPARTQHLCEAWRRVHSLCQQSAASTHPHLLNWLQRHTARTVLQSEWQSPKNKSQHSNLENAINAFIQECQTSLQGRDGNCTSWESQLLQRAEWFKSVLSNPWGHPVLKVLLDPKGDKPSDEQILEWLKEERGVMFVTRLRQLSASKCDDLALSLTTAVMDRVRASDTKSQEQSQTDGIDKVESQTQESPFAKALRLEAGFTADVWDLLTDIELVLLHKYDGDARCIQLAKLRPLRTGYPLVERLRTRLEISPKEKRLWKNAKDVATLVAQVIIARCMVVSACSGACRAALYLCARALARMLGARLPAAARPLAAPAATARHLHTLATAAHAQCEQDMRPFVCELYVRAITAGMNELERLKLQPEKEPETRSMESTLAEWFMQLGTLLSASGRVRCECLLTAFSVHPTPAMYEHIRQAPLLPAMPVYTDTQEIKQEIKSEFGSWATDSRSQTNFVKTSETLNLKQIQNQANVLSTAILTEGETLGLSTELCQDLAVLLSGPRVKTLSWDMRREDLLDNGRVYMERTHGGTKALTTELKYLNLDPKHYEHLPEEEDEENDMYYGIEKGYEHLVECQEPEEIWQNVFWQEDNGDVERTETAYSSCTETETEYKPRRNKKTKAHPISSDEDCDPLSLVAEEKRNSEKKERPHSKERSKSKKSSSWEPAVSKEHRRERRKDGSHSVEKKGRKPRKTKEKTDIPPKIGSLSNLLGMKVTTPSRELEKIHKKERRRSDNQRNHLSITDSDYDSQGKSSLNSDGNDPYVLFDGLFSMDEIKSPERMVSNDKETVFNSNNEFNISNGKVAIIDNKVSSNIIATQGSVIPRVRPKTSMWSTLPSDDLTIPASKSQPNINKKESSEEVKKGIVKLINFRRQKSSINKTNGQNTVGTLVKDNQSIPGSKNITNEHNTVKNISKLQPLIGAKVLRPAELPKVYVNTKTNRQQTDNRNESNTIIGLLNNDGKITNQYSSKVISNTGNETILINKNISNRQAYAKQTVFKKQHIIDHTVPDVIHKKIANTASHQPVHNVTKYEQPTVNSSKAKSYPKCFEDFLKELQESINAGTTGRELSEHKTVNQHTEDNTEDNHTIVRHTPYIPSGKADLMSPQCAKHVQTKKPEYAPNTFARLSYMHKNKQTYSKPKQTDQITDRPSQLSKIDLLQLEHNITEHKISKMKLLNKQNLSALATVRFNNCAQSKSKDTAQNFVKQYEKPTVVETHPVLSNLLETSQSHNKPMTKPDNLIQEHNFLNNKIKCQTSISISNSNKGTLLSEKDQQDLLTLLQQKSKFNPPVSHTYTELLSKIRKVEPPVSISNSVSVDVKAPSSEDSTEERVTGSLQSKADLVQLSDSNFIQIPDIKRDSVTITRKTIQTKPVKNITSLTVKPNTIQEKNVYNEKDIYNTSPSKDAQYCGSSKLHHESEQEWKSVMDAILAHKTPSRGPNALDIALMKSSYDKQCKETSLRNQRIVRAKPVGDLVGQISVDVKQEQMTKPIKTLINDRNNTSTKIIQHPKLIETEPKTPINSNHVTVSNDIMKVVHNSTNASRSEYGQGLIRHNQIITSLQNSPKIMHPRMPGPQQDVQSKVKQYPVIKNKNSPMTTYSHQSAKPEQEIKVGQKLVNNSIHLTKSTHPHSNTVKTDQEIKVNQSKVVNTSTDFTKITYKNANTLKPGQKIKIRQSQDNSNIAKPDPKNKIRQSQDNSNIVKLDPKNKISQSQAKKSLEYNNSMTVKQNIAVSKDQYTKSVNCTKVTYNIPKLGSELNVAVREKQINRSVVKPTVSPSIPIKEHRNPKKFVHSYSKTIKPEQNITSVLVANSNVDLVHNDLRIAKPEQNVQTRHNKIQKSNQAEAKKLLFVSDVQNSEYDLIEELMDDDLRQEIGELSSDEEVHPPVTTALSKNKANFTLQRNNSCNKPITTSGNIHPKRTLNLQERTKQIEAPITKIMNNPPKTCLRNPTIGATPEFRNLSEIRSICVNSNGSNLNKTMENTSIQILNTTLPISKNIAEPKSNNESCLLSTNIVNNNQISANAPQVYIGSQHTALQNVLVIGSELIYEPYPTIQIQDTQITTNLSGLTQNAYVTVNGIPNITVFQSTQFAAPIANPVIIGNATTAPPKNVSKVISTYNNVQSMPNHSDLIDQNILSEVSIKLNKHNQLNPKQVIPNEGSNFELQQCNNISLIDSNNKPGNIVNSDVNLNHERNKLMQSDSSVNQDKQDRHNQKFGADGTVFENTTKPHHCSKVNRYQEDTKLVNKVITDYNLNKNKERKVLSEVQEKLKLYNPQKTDNYGINYRLTLDNDTKEEQERLKNKRLAIINRKINNHTFYPPIPLTYIPLNNGAVDESDKPNSISNIMNDSILHLNVIDKPQTIKSNEIDIPETSDGQDIKHKELNDDHSKENNNLSCRRILLRSSNELKDTVISSITNQKNVIGRKRKVRLKKSSHMSKKQNVIDNVNEQKNVISNKESVNSTRRASKRIKNKPTQKMKLKQTVNVSEIKCSKNIIQQNYIDQVSSSNIPTFIDIESELVGSVVLKTKLPEKSDHCETPTLKTKPPEAVTDNIEKPTLECDKNSENKLVVEKDKSNEILGKGENMDNIDKNNKIKEIQDNKSDSLGDPKSVSSWKDKRECVRKRGEDIKITTLNKAKLINNNIIKDITKSPSGPLVNKDNYKDTDKRNLKNPLITNTSVGGVIRNFNEMDKVESEPEPNRYQSKGDTPNSENDIIIEEIKTNNVSGSLKRQLHVKLPNKQNKSFKVTICSESSSNFDCNSLFSHGAFKSFLSKNSNTVSKFSLNIKHDPRNSDTNKISEISIHEIFTHKSTMGPNARGIEVVDLLSDDENGDELLFKTEFGYYAIKNLDQNIFQKHQKKFTQKCTVKVNKYKAKNTYKDKQNNLCENNGQSSKNGKCTTTSDDIISLSSDEAISDNDIDGPLIPCQYSDTVKISSTQLEDDKLIVNDIHKIQRALEFVEIDDSSDDDDAPGNKVNILHNLDIESEESSETNRNTTTNINCPLSFPKYDDLNQKHKNNKTHPCYINLVRCDDLLKIRNKLENETVEVSEDSPAFPTIELSGDSPTSESENSPIFPTIKLSEDSSAFPTTKISEDTLVSETEDSPASPTIEFSEDSPASPIIELSENSPASPTIEFSEESPPSPTGSFSILQDYTFSDEHLPAEEIFVVPVGIDSSLITYSRNFDITESQNKLLNYRETGAISHNSIKQPPKVLIYECEWFITKSMLSYYQGLTFVSNSKSTTHSSSILENNNTRESISDCSIVDSNKDVRSTQTLTVPTLLQMLTNFVNNSDFECNLPRVHQQVQNSIEIPPRKLKRKLIASKESNTKIKIPKKYVIAEIQETTVQEIQEMSKIYSYTDNENCERNVTESFESNNLSIRNVDNCPNGNPDTLICNGTVDKEMKNNLLNEDFIGNEMNVDGVLMNKDTNQDVSEEPINESEELNVEAVHSYAKAVENSKSQSIQFTNTSDSNMKDVIKCDIQNIDQCQIKRTQTDNATTINKEQNERHLCESSKNINNVLLQEQTIIDVIENNVLCENSLTNNHTIPDQLHINNVPIANGESRGICDESGKSSFTFDEDSVNNEKEIINNSCESITNVPTFNNSSKNDVKCETSGESSNHTDDIVHRDEGPKSTKICNDAKLLNTNTIIEQPNELLSVEISNGNNSSSKILEKSPFNDAIYNKLTDSTVPVPNSTDVQLQDIEIAHVVHKNNILNTGMAPNTAEEKVDATESNTNALRRNSLDSNVELSNRDVEIAKSPILKCQPIILKYRYPVLGKYYTVPYTKAASLSIKNSCVSDNTEKVIKVVPILNNDKFTHENNAPEKFHEDFEVNLPNATYKKKSLKRKLDMRHVKTTGKKYRKAKNIDNGIITANSIRSSGLRDEFNRLFNYYNSVKFSYSQSFLKEQINVHELLKDWPIQGTCDDESPTKIDNNLFEDMKNIQRLKYIGDPLNLSLPEEITAEYVEINDPSIEINEINFNTGFGDVSDRVIQNLEHCGDVSKFSAAALSDVKQYQPLLLSEECNNNENTVNFQKMYTDQIEKIKRHITYLQIKNYVQLFFKNTRVVLSYKRHDTKRPYGMYNTTKLIFDLCKTIYVMPPQPNCAVHVVQVGQLPVSAAAQNPVTCDPRVTQVSDASPPQCSVENSPSSDSQTTTRTQYTELTTADITLPIVQEYVQQSQMTIENQEEDVMMTDRNISIDVEIKSDEQEMKEELEIKEVNNRHESNELKCLSNTTINNIEFPYDTSTSSSNSVLGPEHNVSVINSRNIFNSTDQVNRKQSNSDNFLQEKEQAAVKLDQIAHAMNAAGISTTVDTEESVRVQTLVNALAQKLHQNSVNNTQTTSSTTYAKSTSINAMALQQALAQILPPPLNQTNGTENSQPLQNTPVTSQVLHIVQGKNASGNQITLVDNTQQSVINTPNATQVLHIVQNKTGTSNTTSNGPSAAQSNPFSALSLVDAGLQRGGNQLLHIVNTGNQKNNTGQILKRVNLLTNLQGSNEQKVVQFVCKSADGKSINLNAPHQRSMVLRLQPIDSSNVQPVQSSSKPESQEINVSSNPTSSVPLKENITTQQEIKSRSVFEENYAKFVQNSSPKLIPEKSTSLPKFNQAFGKPVFQDDNQKHNDINSDNSHLPPVNTNDENPHCPSSDNTLNLEHMGQMGNPPLLLKKTSTQTSQSQPNLVQQIKQTITPMNIQTMHGGVIYTRQIPVNIGGGQTINLITVPSTELVEDSAQKHQSDVKFGNQNEIEPSIIKIMPQGQTAPNPETSTEDTSNNHLNTNNENAQQAPPQPPPQVLTQMRIKLPMLSKTPQMVSGARVVRPSFLQIQRNVIGGANQSVYQQLVLTAAPPLGQQSIRLPQTQTQPLNQTPTQPQAPTQQQTQTQANRPVKVQPESQSSQSSSESQMSSSTLEQLREFDMVLEQVKERSTVQPNTSSNSSYNKIRTPSSDTTDSTISPNSSSTESSQQVLYSMGSNSSINVPYSNRKTSTSTPTTSTFVRSPDSSGIADSPTSSSHIPHTVTSESSSNEQPTKPKKSKSRPKSSSHPNSMKLSNIPPKTSTQKPLEDEQTTQRILYILAEYKEQVENSPDKDKPAPRRRNNIPTNPANPMSTNNNNNTNGNSKRKKSSSSCRRSGRELSPLDDGCRTMGSEDSSCGTSQGDCTESCLDSHSPQDSPRKVVRRLTFEQESPVTQVRTIPHRNVIVADGQTITVARGAGKPTTAVLMPANYILPVSMVKSGQQIAIVTNRGPKLLTVGGGEGGTTNALLLQRLIGPGLKPVLARPGVRHVRLPAAALHNLQTLNLATATTVNPPERTASSTSAPTPPDLVDTRATSSPWTDRVSQDIKPDRCSSPEGSEPWNLVTSDPQDYSYEETVRTDNMDRTVLVVQRRDGPHRQHRLTHVSAAALRHKYAILEHELRLQKSLSEECEDLGVDSPSASELFPEADLLFATSPAHDHTQEHGHHSHTPQPTTLNQSNIPQPDIDDQIATDQLLTRDQTDRSDLGLGLEDVGIVTVSEDGMRATIELDQEEFARSHPNTTFHRESSEEGMVQPFTITNIKGRHITSVYHTNTAPATVLMSAPQATVISQATTEASNVQNAIKYTDIDNMINSLPQHNNDINLSSVLVNKDEGLTRFDGILTDSRELHLSNTASAIVHSTGNATQVIRRVCYDDDKRQRESRFIMEDPVHLIAGDDAKMIPEDSGDPGMEPIGRDMDDDRYSPERHAELFWESNSASERSESRRPLDFSSDSDKCCKSPYNDTNSTDSSGVGTHMRLDSVIKEARGRERSGSADGSSDDMHPPLRTYPPKRSYHLEAEVERSLSGKTRAGELSPDISEVRRRASGRGVVKRGCHCCNGSPAPPRAKKPRIKKTISD